jgi:lactoylglutathione lyase
MKVSYTIVFVSDMGRSVLFYRDVLGLPLRFASPGWSEFATEGATLALHAGDTGGAQAGDPPHAPAGRCRPGLSVPDLDGFHRRMAESNVPCVQEPRASFGARTAQYLDPDGLVITVGEASPR